MAMVNFAPAPADAVGWSTGGPGAAAGRLSSSLAGTGASVAGACAAGLATAAGRRPGGTDDGGRGEGGAGAAAAPAAGAIRDVRQLTHWLDLGGLWWSHAGHT